MALKQLKQFKTSTYFVDYYSGEYYYLDIVTINGFYGVTFEAYLFGAGNGIKELLFGMDKKDITYNNFKKLAIRQAQTHIPQYEIDYR